VNIKNVQLKFANKLMIFFVLAMIAIFVNPLTAYADRRNDIVGMWEGTFTGNQGLGGKQIIVHRYGTGFRAEIHMYPLPNSPRTLNRGVWITDVWFHATTGMFELAMIESVYGAANFATRFVSLSGDSLTGHLDGHDGSSMNLRRVAVDRRDDLLGIWRGTNTGGQGLGGKQVLIYRDGFRYRAMVHVYPIAGSQQGFQGGSFLGDVRFISQTGAFEIIYTQTIQSPGTAGFGDRLGTLSGNTFSGQLRNRDGSMGANTSFSLQRATTTDFPLAARHDHVASPNDAGRVINPASKSSNSQKRHHLPVPFLCRYRISPYIREIPHRSCTRSLLQIRFWLHITLASWHFLPWAGIAGLLPLSYALIISPWGWRSYWI